MTSRIVGLDEAASSFEKRFQGEEWYDRVETDHRTSQIVLWVKQGKLDDFLNILPGLKWEWFRVNPRELAPPTSVPMSRESRRLSWLSRIWKKAFT